MSEPLEQRTMLTTVINSGTAETVLEYVQGGQSIRMRVTGNISMEVLGAAVSGIDNRARIVNLPSRLFPPNQPPIDIAGGPGGPGGIDIIGQLFSPVTGNPDINAIAAEPTTGDIYAFDIETIPIANPPPGAPNFITNVHLIQTNFVATPPNPPYGPGPGNTITVIGTPVANITAALQGAGQFAPVALSVAAAAFNPVNGLLYFVVRSGGGTDQGAIDQMFTLDVNGSITGSVNLIPGIFNDTIDDGIQVSGIAFDQTGPTTVQLIAAIGDDSGGQGGGGGGGAAGQQPAITANPTQLVIVSPTNTNAFLGTIPFADADPGPDDITVGAIEVLEDQPNQVDSLILIGPNLHWMVTRNHPSGVNGLLLNLGPLSEPPVPAGDPPLPQDWVNSSAASSGLTFVPTLFDPFTQELGAYVGYDQATDRFFFVNVSEFGNPAVPTTIYQIFVASSDTTARITISQFDPTNLPNRPMIPFAGTSPNMRVFNAQNGNLIDVAAGSNVGAVFVGALTRDLNPNIDDERRPLLDALVEPGVGLGLLPGGSLSIDPATGLPLVPAGFTLNGDVDRFMLGGTLTGAVTATGSINQMYVGWLLTGDARGEAAGPATRPQNFRVGGDLRSLYVLDSIGTNAIPGNNPTYLTGFALDVQGTVGHIRSGDSVSGGFQVRNHPEDDATTGIDIPQGEMEWRTNGAATNAAWDAYQLSGNPFFTNDSFDTAEFRGSIAGLSQTDMVRATGTLQHQLIGNDNTPQDWVDYYAVSLMAGQTIQVQLLADLPVVQIGVFDPDGRLIASDYSDTLALAGQVFGFTTDRPGAYRFAVAASGNGNFVYAPLVNLAAIVSYEIRVTNVGDLAVGGVTAVQNIYDQPVFDPSFGTRSFFVESGDMGSFRTGGAMLSVTAASAVTVADGNLRELDGASIGLGTAAAPGDPNNPDDPGTAAGLNSGVHVDVPAGSVGLVRARTGILFLQPLSVLLANSIGGDYQVIDGASSVGIDLIADGGLGVLRAGDMATNPASTITLNFDNTGRDGIIDLIDVVGTFGTIASGGPSISTGTGGNVRYMRVGGAAFIDATFGGGNPIRTLHLPGEVVSLTDDGGAAIRISPAGRVPINSNGNPADLNALVLRTYPIKGSGGVVVIDITTDDSVDIDTSGSDGATAEIGTIRIAGARAIGPRVVRDPNQRVADFTTLLDFFAPVPTNINLNQLGQTFDPINPGNGGNLGEGDYRRSPNPLILSPQVGQLVATLETMRVNIRGNVKTDVFAIIGQDTAVDGDGQFSLISNSTSGGEMVNIAAVSVGEIVSNGTIGLARSSISNLALHPAVSITGASIPFPSNEYPFGPAGGGVQNTIGQRNGVWIYGDIDENHEPLPLPVAGVPIPVATTELPEPGNVISIRARDGLGNIIVNGSIGELIPNKDGLRNRAGIFAGIQGPVWARGNPETAHVAFSDEGGDIYFVDIGEGITATGSGSFARSGIFAGRRIELVQGSNADIRGDIVAGDANNPLDLETNQTVVNGQVVAFSRRISIPDSIGRVVLTDGSIINADVMVTTRPFESREQGFGLTTNEYPESVNEAFYELGKVEVRGNGGIIGSFFMADDVGPIDVNRGFGIFNSAVIGQVDSRVAGLESDNYGLRGVIINANGSMGFLNARGDGSSISTAAFSPSVRRSEPQFAALDSFGVDPLSGLAPSGLTDIHSVLFTSQATPEIPGRTDTGVMEDINVRGQRDLGGLRAQILRATSPDLVPSRLTFGNSIGTFVVRDQINGLAITTGRFGNFAPQGDVFNLDMTVAGPIKNLVIKGDLAEGSVIRTSGPSGRMGSIRINGRLDGDILSSRNIKRLFVAESISGNISAMGGKGNAVNELIIGGDIAEGGLNIQGSIGRLKIGGDFGRTGTTFTVQGKLGSLTVGGNLFSNVRVGTTFGKLKVGGSIISGVLIEARKINSINVGGDIQPDVIIRATKSPKIKTGGQMLGTVEIIP